MSSSTTVKKLTSLADYATLLIIALVPFTTFLTVWAGSNFHHLDLFRIWKEILLALITPVVAWIIFNDYSLRKWFLESKIVRLFGLFVLLNIAMSAWALANNKVNASATIYGLIVNLRFFLFFIVCSVLAAKTGFLHKHWKKIIVIPALMVIVFGIIQSIFLPNDFLRHFGYGPGTVTSFQTVNSNPDLPRLQSTLRGPNPLGAYLVLILPMIFFIARENVLMRRGALLGGAFVLFYTYSRSAWLGMFLCVVSILFLTNKLRIERKHFSALLLAALVGIALISQLSRSNQDLQDTILHTSSSATTSSSNEVRASAISSALKDIEKHPLGGGPGTAGPASFRNSGHEPKIAENYFLQIGQEVGVVGMMALVAIMMIAGYQLWQRRDDQLAKVLLATFVGITFINLVSHAWADDTLAYIWWGLAGIVLAPTLAKLKR